MSILTKSQVKAAADDLYMAEVERRQVEALTLTYPDMQMEDSYAVQAAVMQRKMNEGRKVIGYKVGLTSRVMQRSMKIDEPDYGVLLDDMKFEDGSDIETARFTDPRVEMELAFVLKQPLFGENLNIMDVLNATYYVIPALELIAARSHRVHPKTGYVRTVMDTIADNAASAGVIMGGNPIRPDSVDLRWCGGIMYRNAVIEETGLAAAVLNHPANGIVWLARRFAAHGIALEPGQILLSGSFTAAIPVKAGDTIHADYGPLGSIACRFV